MSTGLIVIEVCDANPACTDDLFQLEEEFPGLSVLETSCMSECELCATYSYVFLNGGLLFADSVPELLAIIRQKIKETLDFYETEI